MTLNPHLHHDTPLGGTDSDPEPRQVYDLICSDCHWQGMTEHTHRKFIPDPQCPDEVVPELCCPICGSMDFKF